jgi:hypothetical protein
VITNIKDEHDFKTPWPYEQHREYHGEEIVAQQSLASKKAKKSSK